MNSGFGVIPVEVWREGKQFLLSPDNQVWEKEYGLCYAWDSYKGVFGRDLSLSPIRWVDLVKDRAPLKSVSVPEAMIVLLAKWVQEVYSDAQAKAGYRSSDR